jgi:hypothetical protein
MNEEGSVLSKQIFREYQLVSGLRIPTELVQVVFINEQEVYQTITLSNIKINNVSNEDYYNHPIR